MLVNADDILMNPGDATPWQMALGVTLTLALLYAAYRTVGLVITALSAALLAYALFVQNLGYWSHPPIDLEFLIETLFPQHPGDLRLDRRHQRHDRGRLRAPRRGLRAHGRDADVHGPGSLLVAGRMTAGPAKVAVIASSLFGMISGSGAGNAAVTGSMTIPMMTRYGCTPTFAAAVEATAATGGQILPPIMGVGAFLMAEFLNVGYWQIAIAAAIPALLYVVCILSGVHFEGKRTNLAPVPADRIPRARDVLTLRRMASFVLPIAYLVYQIGAGGSITLAAFYAILLVSALYLVEDLVPRNMLGRLRQLGFALVSAGEGLAYVAILIAVANIAVSVVGLTGIGIKLAQFILLVMNGSTLLGLVVAAFVCLVLGTGLPTTPSYVLAAAIVAAPLIQSGIPPIASHLFLFYFACLSDITPPVCAAVYIAAGLAKTSWVRTAFVALRLGAAKFIAPFLFAFSPGLLMDGPPIDIVSDTGRALAAVVAVSAATARYSFWGPISWLQSGGLLVGALLIVMPSWTVQAAGAAMLVATMTLHVVQLKRATRPDRAAGLSPALGTGDCDG